MQSILCFASGKTPSNHQNADAYPNLKTNMTFPSPLKKTNNQGSPFLLLTYRVEPEI